MVGTSCAAAFRRIVQMKTCQPIHPSTAYGQSICSTLTILNGRIGRGASGIVQSKNAHHFHIPKFVYFCSGNLQMKNDKLLQFLPL